MEVSSPFRLPRKTPFGLGENLAEWATGLHKLDQYYTQRPTGCDSKAFLRFTLEILGIDYQVIKGSLTHIPSQGATVVVANHPLGCVEGVILAELLLHVRDDVQILANQYLKTVPELDKLFIGVDVFEGQNAHKANLKALRQAHHHLDQGGLLLLFPAGEVSQLVDRKTQRIEDKEWSRSVSSLVRKAKANTIPMFIDGQNSKRFYMAGKVHPLLRTLMLGRELLNKTQQPINISIGSAIKFKEVNGLTDAQIVNYLRLNTYLLQNKTLSGGHSEELEPNPLPVAHALPAQDLKTDLAKLPAEHHLLTSGEFDVYCTDAEHIPSLLHEIGRLRENNFRKVGEGTGLALDIDEFDRYYKHLFIWDRDNECLVGAYRLGLIDKLMQHKGLSGLYSRTLFHYGEDFLNTMGKSIEMGRSVIDERYQKSMGALLLLWRGIATFVHHNPNYTHLFGPVSISNDYSEQARQLLADTMTLHHYDSEKAEYVTPSNPLPVQPKNWNTSMLTALGDLQLLSRVIARIDDGKGVPVLLRQYLGLNGKLVSFNVDPSFNNALDGLIMVDLQQVPVKTLARYMGTSQAQQYLAHHTP
ncbi:lysophospholipid acyltransferase family protein [Vibrio coralliilyticus]|uniref:lysophospholipid acyltransferase family protein n=1 Tax=Vibrio coralliilyticus TaxID=190893 RepID=UPI0024095821|nr:lysophospholipid acyltransferase family protein [Vibrio coralliilyticus]WFB48541.1 lysophospholipid acyltransferase family protein [Vibrio coralliilyticus]